MPLTYLIDHFNSRIRQGEPRFLPENPIVECSPFTVLLVRVWLPCC